MCTETSLPATGLPLCDEVESQFHCRTYGRVNYLRVELARDRLCVTGVSPS
jgi:hypothetical protein